MTETTWTLNLLGCWQLRRLGQLVRVGSRQRRLITALALLGPRPRTAIAGLLWPDSNDRQAAASMRVALWHVAHELPGLLRDVDDPLTLGPTVAVDFHILQHCLTYAHGDPVPLEDLRTGELLPGWYEDWVIDEQERFRHLRVIALDRAAERALAAGDAETAETAAITATNLEPLRESSTILLIRAELAAGNINGAQRSYRRFRSLCRDTFGQEPSFQLGQLMRSDLQARVSALSAS
ncbi:BTAD domain-containing putative transcriptional regulator [Arthrobacter sp. OV608]|uniref:AfsR/SARP family transcriptional regulator n=1 Tax=Arthrobacter sp. OV608 TaxID=1882768 RepID=UPI0008CEA590|nr:BTAD domain-containing putative transcriptional regulator [Arthrobacter sp. OV608]SEQ79269.1 DNA-binding transcriptional activator of the SARP family [Arthrobacter sp. OV608]